MFQNLLSKLFSNNGFIVVAQINDRIQPIDRGDVYEDSLDGFIRSNNIGEVTGGGTLLQENNEISYCDIEISIKGSDSERKLIDAIINELESLGAPKGSLLHIEKTGEKIPFGKLEGLAIYLDGVNLPDETYKDCDSNFVVSEINRLAGLKDEVVRHWTGNTETGIYFYGNSFEDMRNAILEFVNSYPLCKGARIEKIA